MIAQAAGRLDDAEAAYVATHAHARRGGDGTLDYRAHYFLGELADVRGDLPRAAAGYVEGLAGASEAEEQWDIAIFTTRLGQVARDQGHYSEAQMYFRSALARLREFASPTWHGLVRGGLRRHPQRRGLASRGGAPLRRRRNAPRTGAWPAATGGTGRVRGDSRGGPTRSWRRGLSRRMGQRLRRANDGRGHRGCARARGLSGPRTTPRDARSTRKRRAARARHPPAAPGEADGPRATSVTLKTPASWYKCEKVPRRRRRMRGTCRSAGCPSRHPAVEGPWGEIRRPARCTSGPVSTASGHHTRSSRLNRRGEGRNG